MAGFRRRSARPTRTLTSVVLRAVLPRAAVFAAGTLVLVVGHAMAVAPSGSSTAQKAEQVVSHAPAWSFSDLSAFPGCVPSAAWPAGKPAGRLVVHGSGDEARHEVAFDAAWRVNHDADRTNDVWVVGVCG